jgi:hypothetical protein
MAKQPTPLGTHELPKSKLGGLPAIAPKPRGDVIRIRLECTAGMRLVGDGTLEQCGFKTKLYPERDRASARKELGEHAVEAHSAERRLKIITERREEALP